MNVEASNNEECKPCIEEAKYMRKEIKQLTHKLKVAERAIFLFSEAIELSDCGDCPIAHITLMYCPFDSDDSKCTTGSLREFFTKQAEQEIKEGEK